jgi:hypothetical protein
VPQTFRDQLAIVEELVSEVRRMEEGERGHRAAPSTDGYERELRLAGLAQRIAQAYTIMEGVMSFVARRIDRAPVAGEDWHRALIERCAQPHAGRPAMLPASLARDLLELSQFRHVVRNIYPTRLQEARVADNLARLIRAAPAFAAECDALAASLPRTPSPKARARGTRRSRS